MKGHVSRMTARKNVRKLAQLHAIDSVQEMFWESEQDTKSPELLRGWGEVAAEIATVFGVPKRWRILYCREFEREAVKTAKRMCDA